MKVLWFTNTPSLYDLGKHSYHGGGWIESLERLMNRQESIDLAVSFFHGSDKNKVRINETTYYPIKRSNKSSNPVRKIINNWKGNSFDGPRLNDSLLKVIDDYNPDIIQVFGSEGAFGVVQELTDIPVVIHIQGIINPYLNTYYPVNTSENDFLFDKSYLLKNLFGSSPAFGKKQFLFRAEREERVLSNVSYVTGRTEWDKQITGLYNPDRKYYHVDEVLRPIFYEESKLKKHIKSDEVFTITSTISPTVYKGIDVVLKTAKKLKEITDIHFKWNVIGLAKNDKLLKHFEKSEKIDHHDMNVFFHGRQPPDALIRILNDSDVFIHPSYIDNSPNSVCEAQILGLPVIACNVGGVSTLIKHDEDGYLVPSNGVYEIVYYIRELFLKEDKKQLLGENAKINALSRHDRQKIVSGLLKTYLSICKK